MSKLPEDWYEAINQATGIFTARRESDRVADALEPLLRPRIYREAANSLALHLDGAEERKAVEMLRRWADELEAS